MALLVSVGALFISLGVVLVAAVQILLPRPYLMVLTVSSAFTYSLASVLSAALWFAIPPLKETYGWVLFVAVTVQECSRLGMYLVFAKFRTMGDGVQAFLRPGLRNQMLTGLAVGLGYASTSVLVNYYSNIADSYMRDTAIYLPQCPEINFFVAGAAISLAYSIMHLILGLLVWPWYDSDNRAGVVGVYAVHLAMTLTGLGNTAQGGCRATLGALWGATAVLTAFAFITSLRRISSSAVSDPSGNDGSSRCTDHDD